MRRSVFYGCRRDAYMMYKYVYHLMVLRHSTFTAQLQQTSLHILSLLHSRMELIKLKPLGPAYMSSEFPTTHSSAKTADLIYFLCFLFLVVVLFLVGGIESCHNQILKCQLSKLGDGVPVSLQERWESSKQKFEKCIWDGGVPFK